MEKLIPSMSLGPDIRYKEIHVLVIPALLNCKLESSISQGARQAVGRKVLGNVRKRSGKTHLNHLKI